MPLSTRELESRSRGIREGYRSGLEEAIAEQLEQLQVKIDFENHCIEWEKPVTTHKYTPDFILPNGIIIESKGRFTTDDRKKHKYIKAQHPGLDIRFVFSNPRQRISKRSKTTYGAWSEQQGILYAAKLIPKAWIEEPWTYERWGEIEKFRKGNA